MTSDEIRKMVEAMKKFNKAQKEQEVWVSDYWIRQESYENN